MLIEKFFTPASISSLAVAASAVNLTAKTLDRASERVAQRRASVTSLRSCAYPTQLGSGALIHDRRRPRG
jgi:hypothetical protein